MVQIDSQEAGLQEENAPQHQIPYQKMFNKDLMNKEDIIPQQQAQGILNQKKTMKTQAVQVNEKNKEERQISGSGLNRPDHPRTIVEECLRKEPFFVNHYYSHPVGQCCCQQHAMMVRKGETTVQSSIAPTYEKSDNSRKPQQSSEIKTSTSIMHSPNYNTIDEQDKMMPQRETRALIVEPQLHFGQPLVPNHMNIVPPHAIDTTVLPPLMTKKETEETSTHIVDNTKTPQKDEELLKVVQTVAESLQQQIVLGMCMADMSQQRTDALIGELIKSHNRRYMDHILNNIPTFNGLDWCVDWVTRIRNACEQLNRDFKQELKNKSELMVQNFIKGLGTDISDDEIMNRILGFFSDIPTPYHAMDKIKSIKQNNEPMPQFNQKYRMYIECLERKAVNDMTSHTQMELYMSAINPHIAKALRTNIHYGSRYAATSVGYAMKKAEECYLKDLYV